MHYIDLSPSGSWFHIDIKEFINFYLYIEREEFAQGKLKKYFVKSRTSYTHIVYGEIATQGYTLQHISNFMLLWRYLK